MQFKDIVMQRYATKKFDGRKISEDKIGELLELVRYAPSALNLQPWKIKIVTDQKTKEQLRPAANNQEQITSCSPAGVLCRPRLRRTYPPACDPFSKIGCSRRYSDHGDRHGPGFYPENATGTETCMVAGPDVSRARERP